MEMKFNENGFENNRDNEMENHIEYEKKYENKNSIENQKEREYGKHYENKKNMKNEEVLKCEKKDEGTKKTNNGKGSKFRKILNKIEYTITILIIIASSTLIIESAVNPRKTPNLFGKKAFIIISGSMIPTIQIGDMVVLNNKDNPEIRNIIGFRDLSSSVIVHRVIDKKDENGEIKFQTQGDNNNIADLELVEKDNIEGIYIFKIPVIGKIFMFLYNNLALVVIILVVLLLIKFFF